MGGDEIFLLTTRGSLTSLVPHPIPAFQDMSVLRKILNRRDHIFHTRFYFTVSGTIWWPQYPPETESNVTHSEGPSSVFNC